MSSMRNAVQRRNHKERAQPLERQKLGLLEKKKDYRLRAQDYNAKKAKLKLMQEKAEFRNPDEFHYGMINARVSKGIVIGDRGNEALSNAAVQLLKTQDANYLRLKSAEEQKKIERLEQELSFMDVNTSAVASKKHTVFVDSIDEAKTFDPAKHFDTPEQLLGRAFNRPRNDQLASGAFIDEAKEALGRGRLEKKVMKQRNARYKELEARLERAQELKVVEEQLQLQREKMAGGKRNGNKWSKVRKR